MAAHDWSRRAGTPELMDTEDCGFTEFQACLIDLASVNQLTMAYRPTISWLNKVFFRQNIRRVVHIVDVGSGYGDMLRHVAGWAAKAGIEVKLTGIDLNPWSRQAAETVKTFGPPINWITSNLFEYQPETPVDIVLSSLFAHHLTNPEILRFLGWMERTSTIGWLVNDLHRHAVPYHFFRQWAKLAKWHRFVQHDGPVSITRAFDRADWEQLLTQAGFSHLPIDIQWWFPFRYSVGRIK